MKDNRNSERIEKTGHRKGCFGIIAGLAILALLLAIKAYRTAPTEFTAEDLCSLLQQQSEICDFTPRTDVDDWTYFYVADMRSVYRISEQSYIPELVCGDCDGNVQVLGDTLYFLRKGNRTSSGQWIAADLDGTNQRVLSSRLDAYLEGWKRTVVGDYLLIEGEVGTGFVPLDGRRTEAQLLTIAGKKVEELLWTNGTVLYFTTVQSETDPERFGFVDLWRYDFAGEPQKVDIPDTYEYGSHTGGQVFFRDRTGNAVYALSMPEEKWTRLGYGGGTVYPVENGEYLYCAGERIERFDDAALGNENVVLRTTKGVYYGLLNAVGDHWICTYMEYHSNWKTCGCKDADYMHYYIRTQVVSSETRTVLWHSEGDCYIMDY